MKTGKTLIELATEVQRQAEAKKDYVASTKDMKVVVPDGDFSRTPDGRVKLELGGKSGELLDIGDTAHSQIATQADIPLGYYRRMLAEQPELLARNVNTWFAEKPAKRMLRTLDGKARALLSDKYRPLDNYELLEAALPALQSASLELVSAEVTESRLYLKAVDRAIQRHIPNGFRMGDGSHQFFQVPNGELIAAVMLGNSEIGYGNLSVERGWLNSGCTNLAWGFKSGSLKKRHVGARLDIGEDLYKVLTDETRRATDQAVWLQFRDTVKAAVTKEGFDQLVDTLIEAGSEKIEADVVKVVEVTAKRFGFNDDLRSSVLKHLIEGGDLSKYGLANAVTSAANEAADYDRASELETLGGRIIELPKHQWKQISTAKVIDAEWKDAA
jgi:hypothetical protein